jgi:uncharacterized protein YbcI
MANTYQTVPGAGAHAVLFYEDESELTTTVASYLGEAITAGEVAMVIATEPHRRAFEAQLRGAGIDVERVGHDGAFVCLDAAATLNTFLEEGRVDSAAFHRVLTERLQRAGAGRRTLRVYGEMVALLWSAGDVSAAIEVEVLWNQLGRDLPLTLLCAYERSAVSRPEHAGAAQRVSHLHSCVLGAPAGHATTHVPADRATAHAPAAHASTAHTADRPPAPGRESPRGPLALQISNAVGHLHKEFLGRGPTKVHTHIDGDLVVCMLEGGLTRGELAVRAHAGDAVAQDMRAHLQDAMRQEVAQAVQAIVGRPVRSSMSCNDPAEDVQLEIVLLAPGTTAEPS